MTIRQRRMTLVATAPGPATVELRRAMRGNSGGAPGFTSKGTFALPDEPWTALFRAVQTRDEVLPLPARVHLGVINGVDEVIEFH